MNVSISPVKFANRRGRQLFGILHEPERGRSGPAILLLSPGIKSRVAPHRLYIKMAERFSNLGFTVLRIDPEGLGDSEGKIEEYYTADVYGSMELGRLVNDTIDTMNWMQSTHGAGKFILSGLCGGAITGLLTGAIDERVDSLLSLGMTCIVSGSNLDPSEYITIGQLQGMRDKYLRKILDPSSWIRLITLRSDFRLLFKSMVNPLISRWSKKKKADPAVSGKSPLPPAPTDTNLNPNFPQAFLSFVQRRKVLLIFSEADRLYWEFEEKFMSTYGEAIAPYQKNFTVHIVKEANHIFSFPEWQKEMLDLSADWLTRNYSSPGELS